MVPPRKGSTARVQEARALERARDLPNARTATDVETLKRAFADHLQFAQGKDEHSATALDRYFAVAYAVRDRMMRHWIRTQQAYYRKDAKRIYYLSLEFLMGRALENNLLNLGLFDDMRGGAERPRPRARRPARAGGRRRARQRRPGPARRLLPRLARDARSTRPTGTASATSSASSTRRSGTAGRWSGRRSGSASGTPGRSLAPSTSCRWRFYGRTEHGTDADGKHRVRWVDARHVLGMPYDMPIAGYRNRTVNTLRLWRARASQELDLADFNAGDYLSAVEDKNLSENISKVLYPNDLTVMGKELRLQQQYFFVACSIHDIVARHLKVHEGFDDFPDKVAIQLNDTHPAIAIAELMRVLVDEHGLEWGRAWEICQATFGYTNHTLMPEALEKWSVDLFGRVLPRHLEIVYELNRRFLEGVRGDARRRRGGHLADEHHRGRARAAGPDGEPRGGGLALGQRGRRASHRAPQARAVPRLLRAVAREVQQQDQRRDAAPLAPAGEPGALERDHRGARAPSGSPTRPGCAGWSRSPRTPGSGGSSAR